MPKKTNTSKEERIFDNLLKVSHQYVSSRGFVPKSFDEIAQQLGIVPQYHKLFRKVLKQLVTDGVLEIVDKRYVVKKEQSGIATGILRVHPRGFGFLQPDNKTLFPQDIFIPRHLTQNAIDGDRVEVMVNTEIISDKGPEGRVLTILERCRTHIGGIIRTADHSGNFIAYCPLLGEEKSVIVTSPDEPLHIGDRIVIEVEDWGSPAKPAYGKVSHLLGHISDASKDITAAIEEFGLPDSFPKKATAEAEAFGSRIPTGEIAKREDLRDLEIVTIDPETAKDFDDAISLTKDAKGCYHLGVHIADVSFYVQRGTALDDEARRRCNSTYFPKQCIPMLPPGLSDNLCSLKPKVNRLTASVMMTFDKEGNLTDYRMARTVIRSAKRFSYEEAKEVLDGAKKSPHLPLLKRMVELCQLLKRQRYSRGSIEFALPDIVINIDENGVPQGTHVVQYDITHQMIEEFMLKANEVVAEHLTKAGKGLTYRVHDVPAEENLREFATIANAFGFHLSDNPEPKELQELFDKALKTPYGPFLATSYIRSMRLAVYSPENIGHYGLSLEYYCHFTSPIRRYVDLVVHRILFGEPDDEEGLGAIAKRSSEQERLSAKAEMSVVLLKKLRLLDAAKSEEAFREYEAVITKVKPFGFYFEIVDILMEGFIHVSKLTSDYFIYEEERMRLRGRSTGRIYHPGDKISVILSHVDLILLESSWDILEDTPIRDRETTESKPKRYHHDKRPPKIKHSKKRRRK